MQEIIDIATDFLRAVMRFRWTALLVAWLLALACWGLIYQLEDKYEANARVFVDSNEVLQPLLRGIAVQPDVSDRVNMMSRMLLSRPNLEKLARMTDIDILATSASEKENLINTLGEQVKLSAVRGNASLYTVSYPNKDPDVARRVVQGLITIFIESTIGDERSDSESAQAFLDQQIRLYETRLAKSEKRLSDFKRDNAGKMPGESGGYYQRLESAISLQRSASLELRETARRRDSLTSQLRSESPTLLVSSGVQGGQSQLEMQLAQQYSELSALQVRYTDRHPKIAQLEDSIAYLEEQRLKSGGQSAAPRAGATYAPNPVYEELRKSLSEAEARIAELEVRVQDYRQQTQDLESTIDSIPLVEAELQQLDRDYTIVKGQYEEVLSRRESARLSDQVEQTADSVQFRVIDPPFVPSKPSGPNKLLFSAAALMFALGAGAALAFGLSLLRPVFYSQEQLVSKTGREVLGTVSKRVEKKAATLSKFAWGLFYALLLLLLLIFVLLLAYYQGFFEGGGPDFIMQSPLGPVITAVAGAIGDLGGTLSSMLGRLTGGE